MRTEIANNKNENKIIGKRKKKKKEIGCKEDSNLLPQIINSLELSNLPTFYALHFASMR